MGLPRGTEMRRETRKIRYTTHAEEQMLVRNISRREVEAIVRGGAREPQGIGHWLAHGTLEGRLIKVAFVVIKSGKQEVILVKTAMD
jgi:hypothetical protein